MGVKVTNNAYGTLSAGIAAGDTTITLDGGQGARFPALGAGDYFYGTLIDTGNNIEVVKVTARSTDSMTVVRGQDNTVARAYAIGDRFELRPTAALFDALLQEAGGDKLPLSGGTLTGDVSSSGKLTLTGGGGYPSTGDTPILELTGGYLYISHDEATILFDAGQKMITSNDNDGNFNIKAGYDNDGYIVTDGGAGDIGGPAQISLTCDGTDGAIHLAAGPSGNHGDVANLTQALSIDKDGVYVSNPNNTYAGNGYSNSSSSQLAKDDYPYGDYICKAWATYEQVGTHSFFDSRNFSSISDRGVGYSRLTFSRAMPNNNYAVVMAENAAGDGGGGGGADATFDPRPGNTSYFDWDNRGNSNSNYDKRWAAVVVYGTGA